MYELGYHSSYVLDEWFQYIISRACDKLIKSHLSRSGMFLDLVQFYIYFTTIKCTQQNGFYYTAFAWWQKHYQVLKCSLYKTYLIQWTLSSIQGIQLKADHKYLATWLATAWVTYHHFYCCYKVILCHLRLLIQSRCTCCVLHRWIVFCSPWIKVLQWNMLFIITKTVVFVPKYAIHCKTEDFWHRNLYTEGNVRASFEDGFRLFHFLWNQHYIHWRTNSEIEVFLLNKLEQLWHIFLRKNIK